MFTSSANTQDNVLPNIHDLVKQAHGMMLNFTPTDRYLSGIQTFSVTHGSAVGSLCVNFHLLQW